MNGTEPDDLFAMEQRYIDRLWKAREVACAESNEAAVVLQESHRAWRRAHLELLRKRTIAKRDGVEPSLHRLYDGPGIDTTRCRAMVVGGSQCDGPPDYCIRQPDRARQRGQVKPVHEYPLCKYHAVRMGVVSEESHAE